MDVGVSAIMFSSGFCSSLIVCHQAPSKPRPYLFKRLYKAVFGNIVVLIGAAIRFFMLHGIDYHEHVTEWGTHWNFFVTIACMNVLLCFVPSGDVALPLGIVTLILNELFQNEFDVQSFVLHAPRDNIITANREGIVSLPGFLAIVLIAMGIGSDIY